MQHQLWSYSWGSKRRAFGVAVPHIIACKPGDQTVNWVAFEDCAHEMVHWMFIPTPLGYHHWTPMMHPVLSLSLSLWSVMLSPCLKSRIRSFLFFPYPVLTSLAIFPRLLKYVCVTTFPRPLIFSLENYGWSPDIATQAPLVPPRPSHYGQLGSLPFGVLPPCPLFCKTKKKAATDPKMEVCIHAVFKLRSGGGQPSGRASILFDVFVVECSPPSLTAP